MDFGKILLKVVDIAKDYIGNEQKSERPAQRVQPEPRTVEPTVERQKTPEEWRIYFKDIITSEFPSYQIRENVAVTDLAGFANDEFKLYKKRPSQAYKAEWGEPYTFVLESDGAAKAVVMLGDGHSHDSKVKFLIARMYAKKLGLPYINFYTQMANERDYVVGRIRKFLN